MGISIFRVSDGCSCSYDPRNPDPKNFEVLRFAHWNLSPDLPHVIVAEIKYPNCSNYEGRKILVFLGLTLEEFEAQREIDPHFTENGKVFARFAPTAEGWRYAKYLAIDLSAPDNAK